MAPVGTADYAKWVQAHRSVLPTSPTRVLDVGTGTGFVARIAAELGTPGGRMVAIYGLSAAAGSEPPPDADAEDSGHEPSLFERHYTPETREELTAMYLTGHESLVTAADAAGFRDVEVIPLENFRGRETSPGSDLPYALSATR